MTMVRTWPALVVAALAVGVAAPVLADESAAAQTTSCLPLRQIDRTEVVDNKTILFHMRGKKVWRNQLPYSCPGLKFEDRFLFKTSISQICSTDIITVLYSAGGLREGASCGLGRFEAYTPPPKDAPAKAGAR
jgi:hypothetical protein